MFIMKNEIKNNIERAIKTINEHNKQECIFLEVHEYKTETMYSISYYDYNEFELTETKADELYNSSEVMGVDLTDYIYEQVFKILPNEERRRIRHTFYQFAYYMD